jgi:hypothetical protein
VASDCTQEATTQHHLGVGHGHGPVRSDEIVLFAVFETTARDRNRLIPTAFPAKQLNKGEVSLARLAYTIRTTFDQRVIHALEDVLGKFVGVARAEVSALRALRFEVRGTTPVITGRAVCVLDKVSPADHDGHAALKYAECQDRLTEKQKSTSRQLIGADLSEAFGDILSLDRAFAAPIT